MQAFEIGELGRVSGTNERFKAGANQRAGAATEDCLLTKKIGLSLLPKVRFEDAGTGAADSFRPRQSRSLRMPAGILVNRNQPWRAATSQKFPAHHRSETLGRDHHNVDIFPRNDRTIINRKAVGEEQSLARTQIWRDLFCVNGRHPRV